MTTQDDLDKELFEKLWHPICPEFDSINSDHVWKFYQAALAHERQLTIKDK